MSQALVRELKTLEAELDRCARKLEAEGEERAVGAAVQAFALTYIPRMSKPIACAYQTMLYECPLSCSAGKPHGTAKTHSKADTVSKETPCSEG